MEPHFFVSYLQVAQIADAYLPGELSEIKMAYLEIFKLIRELQIDL
jgi:hypothetical protein